jgi:hypothetical protein
MASGPRIYADNHILRSKMYIEPNILTLALPEADLG